MIYGKLASHLMADVKCVSTNPCSLSYNLAECTPPKEVHIALEICGARPMLFYACRYLLSIHSFLAISQLSSTLHIVISIILYENIIMT
jgi:hypothetical protein